MGLASMCARCWESLYRCMERPGDTEQHRAARKLMFPVLLLAFTLAVLGTYASYVDQGPAGLRCLGSLASAATCLLGIICLLMRVKVDYLILITIIVLGCTVGLLATDVSCAVWMRFRMWPIVVIVMDLALVFEVPQSVQSTIIALTILAITVTSVESVTSFGLSEALIEFEGGRAANPPVWQCDCAAPPCSGWKASRAALAWGLSSFVFVADYYLTRRFSIQLRSQLDLVAATVRVSERMTHLLAAYATDDARRVVTEEGAALPKALLSSYEQLLDNLDSYRVFLPDSLLYNQQQQQQGDESETDTAAQGGLVQPAPRVAPGSGEEQAHIAVCFTDIQSSTELWEAHPQGMYTALNMHNDVMRSSYAACSGYEVKTIGDSFMVAFDCSFEALRFGLEAQLGLLRQRWPDDLRQHPLCQPVASADGTPLWDGLRVRIGVQSGEARVQRNPVTGRCDYFGPTVNTAARLEAVLRKGGLVATSGTVVAELGAALLQALGTPVLHEAGDRELKGVRDKVKVWAVVPQALAGRLAVLAGEEDTAVVANPPGQSARASRRMSALSLQSGSSLHSSHLSAADDRHARRVRDLLPRRLRCTMCSCAAARLSLNATVAVACSYQHFAAAAALAADQSQGVVDGVMSACVAVTWNASKPCADHAAACRRFLGANFRFTVHLGAASGSVLSGSIAAGRRSFVAVVGGCVDLAAALAEEAERCGDAALVTGAVADMCAAAGSAHWAQVWQAHGCPPLHVMAVQPAEEDELWLLGGGCSEGDGALEQGQWADSIPGLFRRACTGEPGSEVQLAVQEELLRMRSTLGAHSADAAAPLAERIARGGVRTRPMPPLWDADGSRPPSASGRHSVAVL